MDELLELIKNSISDSLKLEIKLDELPVHGGIYAELGSSTGEMYYSKKISATIPVLFLCKNIDQKECFTQLSSICNYLTTLKKYPHGVRIAWLDATTAVEPNKSGRSEDGQYIFSCIINNKVYY